MSIMVSVCARCGSFWNAEDAQWFRGLGGSWCHLCLDGVVGSATGKVLESPDGFEQKRKEKEVDEV